MAASYTDLIAGMTDYAKSTKLNYSVVGAGTATTFRVGGLTVMVTSLGNGYSSAIRLASPVMTLDMQFADVPHAIRWVAGLWDKHRPKQTQPELGLMDEDRYSVNAAWKVIQADKRTFRAIVHRKGNAIHATANASNEAVGLDPDGRVYVRHRGKTRYIMPLSVGTQAIAETFLVCVLEMGHDESEKEPNNVIRPKFNHDTLPVKKAGPPLIKQEVCDGV